MYSCDYLIIGAGVAGMTAAIILHQKEPEAEILLIEREEAAGGILRQCIHTGFGPDNLTGPEYAQKLEKIFNQLPVKKIFGAEVTQITENTEYCKKHETKEKKEFCKERKNEEFPKDHESEYIAEAFTSSGPITISFHKLLLATGCYERPIGSLLISGTRPRSGIFTAGELQRRMNLEGYRPGKSAVVIGSGDIGLLVARRLAINGTQVKRIVEIQHTSPALARNKKRCLTEHQLPLQLHTKVTKIHGDTALEGVTIQDQTTGTEEYIPCEILAVAAGLIPDRMLTAHLPEEIQQDILYLGNCEKVYPMAEHIVTRIHDTFETGLKYHAPKMIP